MTKTRSPGKALSRLQNDTGSALRGHNTRYGALVERSARSGKVSSTRARRLVAVRKGYMARLKQIPFFREVLSKQERLTVNVGGKPQKFTLLKTGIAFDGFDRPIVMVLNQLGRGQLFYKSTGWNSRKPGEWLPFRGIEFTEVTQGHKDWWYQKYAGHPSFPEYLIEIGREIAKHETSIDFKKRWNMDQVEAMKQFLG